MSAFTLSPAGEVALEGRFELDDGSAIDALRIGYEWNGVGNGPVVVVLGGISGSAHVASSPEDPKHGWWEELVGPGRAIDTSRDRVLGLDWLGGRGPSSGPLDEDFLPANPWPSISTNDQAAFVARALDALRIERVHAIVGASYGGMVGLAFAARWPQRVERLVALSAPASSHPWTVGWRSLQRRLLRFGHDVGREQEAVALARGMGMVGYRSPREFGQRFPTTSLELLADEVVEVERYLTARGSDFAATYGARVVHLLSRSIDRHRVEPETVHVPTTVAGSDTDLLVPFEQLRELAAGLPRLRRLVEIPSIYGHDAFLKEIDAVGQVVSSALEESR